MLARYAIQEIDAIYSETQKCARWAQVELAVCWALKQVKMISAADYQSIVAHFTYDLSEVQALEEVVHHDVVAFTRAINLATNTPAKRFIHYGLTSTDVVDSANALAYQQVNELISVEVKRLLGLIKKQALQHALTIQVGRTHGQFAEPTTWGLKLATWYSELLRGYKNFLQVKQLVETGKISGAVGTYAHLGGKQVQDLVCQKLKLYSAQVSSQVLQRDRHAQYFNSLIILCTSIATFATEIRSLSRSEINEVSEGFSNTQKGSSAMPQKKNPIACENICGLVRIAQGFMVAAYENMTLWNERDISHSSAERILNVDLPSILVYVLRRFQKVLTQLVVNVKQMQQNLETASPQIYGQTILLYLIKEHQMPRDLAYDLIQKLIQKPISANELLNALNAQLANPIGVQTFLTLIDPKYHIQHIKKMIKEITK